MVKLSWLVEESSVSRYPEIPAFLKFGQPAIIVAKCLLGLPIRLSSHAPAKVKASNVSGWRGTGTTTMVETPSSQLHDQFYDGKVYDDRAAEYGSCLHYHHYHVSIKANPLHQ